MSYRAIYTYAWDLAEEGVSKATDQFLKLGLDTVTMAGSYHAGKFLRPHGRSGKIYFPEDGTVYFNADPARYGAIKPVANTMLQERDTLRELTDDKRMAVNVWLVLLHNTLLGSAHPEAAVTNAFGDKYIYSLCPSAPAARAYALGLARDVTESYDVSGLSLETPGFLPYAHGYHHEFALNASNRWLDSLLGLCFCDHCVKDAEGEGIDVRRVKADVVRDVSDYLASDVDFPADMADAFWHADTQGDEELSEFLRWRTEVVTSVISEIRKNVRKDVNIAIIPSVARPTGGAWYEGSDLKAQAEAAGIIEACFYEPGAARVKADLFDIKRRLRGVGQLRGIMRPAHPDFPGEAEFLAGVEVLAAGGVKELAFYNWGHLRQANVERIGKAMKILDRYA
ncbi:hypothetical protein [Taklimakanibacter lacteus]|uniref:hypothetical protein n=1 Tax=Taklimakanibacter lacteus TaxID=2268456 RepID=UPI000E661C03